MRPLTRWLETQGPDDGELRLALLDAREGPSEAQVEALARRVAERAAAFEAPPRSEPHSRGPLQRRWRIGLPIGIGLALLLGALLWSARGPERRERQASAPARVRSQAAPEAVSPPPVVKKTAVQARESAREQNMERASPTAQAPAPRAHPPARVRQPARVVAPPQDEVPLLQEARRALLAHPEAALTLAHKHREQFPRGLFIEERASIEVEALWRLGRSREARQARDEFTRRYPHSPYRQRLERLWSSAPQQL